MKLKTKVSKMGEKLIVVIPKVLHEEFPHKTKIVVIKENVLISKRCKFHKLKKRELND